MNIQQLEYIVALDEERHFNRAAKTCNVSQPTLSMMVQKLEEELGIIIFDRRKKPIVPTPDGERILEYARSVIVSTRAMKQIRQESEEEPSGVLDVAVIPTLAPYLIPLFVNSFIRKYPKIKLRISELTTERIIEKLKQSKIDAGILVTPVDEASIFEDPLFYEPFWVYTNQMSDKEFVTSEDINTDELWLLEEGHCFRTQIFKLCDLKRKTSSQFEYQAGSIETLKKLVDMQEGITILPELATLQLNEKDRKKLRRFQHPEPVREVSICTHRNFSKSRLVQCLKEEIIEVIPECLLKNRSKNLIAIK
ncbi:MAG TPA: DNA-binding transcriptional regulator OxyR [Balneolaceae bacterium]|nr:DNA-binding transcriptional regulator OxyR [Balneolaceae bacterium]|tara:strand:+ start:5385 stop:6308 length:924 start_codon:yes stop_codon:yes gene_type:complete